MRVQNQLRSGRILIRKINQVGVPLADACFDLVEDDADAACTNSDGELLFSRTRSRGLWGGGNGSASGL